MNITIIGYVGMVTGACLADPGNHVFFLDMDQSKKIWRKSWLLESLTS
jgi:UDPglucose 6-dehydrogenase